MPENLTSLQVAVSIALRNIDDLNDTEREHVLAAAVEVFAGEVGETATRSLYHLREQRRLQMTLRAVLVPAK